MSEHSWVITFHVLFSLVNNEGISTVGFLLLLLFPLLTFFALVVSDNAYLRKVSKGAHLWWSLLTLSIGPKRPNSRSKSVSLVS